MEYQPKNEKYFFNGKEYLCPIPNVLALAEWGRSVGTKL